MFFTILDVAHGENTFFKVFYLVSLVRNHEDELITHFIPPVVSTITAVSAP